MDYLDIEKNLARQQKAMEDNLSRQQKTINKNLANQQKAVEKALLKQVGLSISKEVRVPIKADLRKKVYARYHDKCHYTGCNIRDTNAGGKVLQIHHIDMNNTHTYLSNLELLCPTHHKMRHNVFFRKRYVTRGMLGEKIVRTRIVSKARNKELNRKKAKQQRTNTNIWREMPKFKQPKTDFGSFGL